MKEIKFQLTLSVLCALTRVRVGHFRDQVKIDCTGKKSLTLCQPGSQSGRKGSALKGLI